MKWQFSSEEVWNQKDHMAQLNTESYMKLFTLIYKSLHVRTFQKKEQKLSIVPFLSSKQQIVWEKG